MVNNPGALNIEFDILTYAAAQATEGGASGASTITIEGVALADLQQTLNFFGMSVQLKGGMTKGLPLANPAQAGLILQGTIYQCYGNWVGQEQSLTLVVYPATFTYGHPGNFVLNWPKGTSLSDALKNTLAVAYPDLGVIVNIANTYVTGYDIHHVCASLIDLGNWLKAFTQTPTSPGVDIFIPANNTLVVLDGATVLSQKVTQIAFNDLIGQPTWIQPGIVQIMTVLRADIVPGTSVKMPPGYPGSAGAVQTTSAVFANQPNGLKYQTAFQGLFTVLSVRQIGNFRDSAGTSWVTVLQCAVQLGA